MAAAHVHRLLADRLPPGALAGRPALRAHLLDFALDTLRFVGAAPGGARPLSPSLCMERCCRRLVSQVPYSVRSSKVYRAHQGAMMGMLALALLVEDATPHRSDLQDYTGVFPW